MRAVIGIGGILAALGVLVWIMGFELGHDKAVIDAGNKATAQVNVVAGRDDSGTPVKQSATLEPQTTNGKIDSILVTGVVADGAYAKVWGLKRNDAIVEIGPLTVQQVVSDAGSADDYVMDAYQHSEPLTVYRDGQKMVLTPTNALTPPASPGASAKPSTPSNPLQNQLDAIQSQQIPTH
jgi:hypothetical protein